MGLLLLLAVVALVACAKDVRDGVIFMSISGGISARFLGPSLREYDSTVINSYNSPYSPWSLAFSSFSNLLFFADGKEGFLVKRVLLNNSGSPVGPVQTLDFIVCAPSRCTQALATVGSMLFYLNASDQSLWKGSLVGTDTSRVFQASRGVITSVQIDGLSIHLSVYERVGTWNIISVFSSSLSNLAFSNSSSWKQQANNPLSGPPYLSIREDVALSVVIEGNMGPRKRTASVFNVLTGAPVELSKVRFEVTEDSVLTSNSSIFWMQSDHKSIPSCTLVASAMGMPQLSNFGSYQKYQYCNIFSSIIFVPPASDCPDSCFGIGACTSNKCSCPLSVYDSSCSVYCDRRNTCSDHGTCDANGTCVCELGYYGESCEKFVGRPSPFPEEFICQQTSGSFFGRSMTKQAAFVSSSRDGFGSAGATGKLALFDLGRLYQINEGGKCSWSALSSAYIFGGEVPVDAVLAGVDVFCPAGSCSVWTNAPSQRPAFSYTIYNLTNTQSAPYIVQDSRWPIENLECGKLLSVTTPETYFQLPSSCLERAPLLS